MISLEASLYNLTKDYAHLYNATQLYAKWNSSSLVLANGRVFDGFNIYN